jgi:hypothetical protein
VHRHDRRGGALRQVRLDAKGAQRSRRARRG